MNTFSIGESFRFGWATFSKRPWFFLGITLCFFIAYSIISSVTDPKNHEPGLFSFSLSIAAMLLGVVGEMILINLALRAHDSADTVQVSDMWGKLPFWSYLAVKLLNAIVVFAGLILLIVPGIIAAVLLLFGNYLVVDRNLGPLGAMKESIRITKGNRLPLVLFILAVVGINILGALALFVGLFVTIPVSMLAMAHVYRTLAHQASELVPAGTNVPSSVPNSLWIGPMFILAGIVIAVAPIVISTIAYSVIPGLNEGQGGLGAVFLYAFITVPLGGIMVIIGIVKGVVDYMRSRKK